MSQPKPGDRFSFLYLDEADSQPQPAIVQRILSNREEGLSPEADLYADEWLEALLCDLASAPSAPIQSITIMLRTDNTTYLEGRPISITFDP